MIKQLNGSLEYASEFEKAACGLIAMFRDIPGSEDVVGFLFTPEEQEMLDKNVKTWNRDAAKLLKEKLKNPIHIDDNFVRDFSHKLSEAYHGKPMAPDIRVVGALATGQFEYAISIAERIRCIY